MYSTVDTIFSKFHILIRINCHRICGSFIAPLIYLNYVKSIRLSDSEENSNIQPKKDEIWGAHTSDWETYLLLKRPE
jgi:hypothetical protein